MAENNFDYERAKSYGPGKCQADNAFCGQQEIESGDTTYFLIDSEDETIKRYCEEDAFQVIRCGGSYTIVQIQFED